MTRYLGVLGALAAAAALAGMFAGLGRSGLLGGGARSGLDPTTLSADASTAAASPAPSPSPAEGSGHWTVNGANVTLAGALAFEVDTGASSFRGFARAAHDTWTARFALSGEGPLALDATVTGPGPAIDAEIDALGVAVTVQREPNSDVTVRLGHPTGSSTSPDPMPAKQDAKLLAAVMAPFAAETPDQVAARLGGDWLRTAVVFTVIGWLLMLVAPGLRSRPPVSTVSLGLKRLGIGALLALDIPLASLVIMAAGLPLGVWWLGLIGLLAFLILVLIGYAYAGFQLTRLTLHALGADSTSWWLVMPLGAGSLVLIGLIPTVGAVISAVATVYGIGALLYSPREVPEPQMLPADAAGAPEQMRPAAGRTQVE